MALFNHKEARKWTFTLCQVWRQFLMSCTELTSNADESHSSVRYCSHFHNSVWASENVATFFHDLSQYLRTTSVCICVCVRACVCVCVCVCVTVGGTRKKGEGKRRGEERRKIMSIYRPNKTLSGNGELSWACVQINPGRPTIKRVWPVWPKMNRPEKPDPRSSSVQEGQQCNSKPAPVAQAPALAVKDNLL